MSEFSSPATFSYTDYRNFDFNPSAAFFGENTAGFTMYALLEGIPLISPLTGESTFCALVVSFGDPNLGVRIGKRITFGPTGNFPVPSDGKLVAAITVGYLGSSNFALAGGITFNIPSGLGTSTIAGYFDNGNLAVQTYAGTLTLYAAQWVPTGGGGGEPVLTERPKNLKTTSFIVQSGDNMDVKVEFDYFNNAGENPNNFRVLYDDDFDTGRELGLVNWVSGVTHYSVTGSITPSGAWSTRGTRNFYARAGKITGQTGPGTNVVSVEPDGPLDTEEALILSPPTEEQVSSPLLVGDTSGIYTLISGQTHDILIEREPFNTFTENVKIPDPIIKTGFVP